MKTAWWIAELLVVVGAINWGLVGLFNFNLVETILGTGAITSIVYILVGVSGVWAIKLLMSGKGSEKESRSAMSGQGAM